MNITNLLQKAIEIQDDAAVDAFMFVSKIEALRNTLFDFQNVYNNVFKYYDGSYRGPLRSIYSKDNKVFFEQSEIRLTEGTLITDLVIKRILHIEKSNASTYYKVRATEILRNYSSTLSPDNNLINADHYLKKNVIKIYFSYALLLLSVLTPVTIYLLNRIVSSIGDNPKNIYLWLVLQTLGFVLPFGFGFGFLYLRGHFKNFSKLIIIFTLTVSVLCGLLGCQYFLGMPYNSVETVTIISLSDYYQNSNIKKATCIT